MPPWQELALHEPGPMYLACRELTTGFPISWAPALRVRVAISTKKSALALGFTGNLVIRVEEVIPLAAAQINVVACANQCLPKKRSPRFSIGIAPPQKWQ